LYGSVQQQGISLVLLLALGNTVDRGLHALPPLERAARYRIFAAEALQRAVQSESGGLKATHLDMAARWDNLAQDIERRLDLLD
jgi:hypothetical protein